MNSEIKIRAAKPEDAPGVARVHIKSWQETYRGIMPDNYIDNLGSLEGERRLEFWKNTLSSPEARRTTWVAEKDNEIVGFVSVGKNRDEAPVSDGEIYAIYLLKVHHGCGVGRALFEAGMMLLKEMGMKSASLWVAKGNATEGFYKHLGGALQGEKVDKCGGVDALAECRYVWPELIVKANAQRQRAGIKLTPIELKNEGHSLRELQELLEAAPTYHTRVNGIPVGPGEAERLFSTLPPGKTESDKTVLGFYLDGKMIGCADILRGYPNSYTCFLGLLLIHEDFQCKGYGVAVYRVVEKLISEWGTFKIIRLATVGTNSDVGEFWTRMGFRETGERKPYQQGGIISEYILFEKKL